MVWLAILFLLQLLSQLSILPASASGDIALPNCPAKCGNVSIPYPFGIGQACSLQGFNITCNKSSSNPHKPFLGRSNIEVVEIKLSEGLVVVNQYMAYHCYNKDGSDKAYNNPSSIYLGNSPYKFLDNRNKFIAIGCDTIGYIYDEGSGFQTGCLSMCNNASNVSNGTCSGIGCCEAPIPKGLQAFKAVINSFSNHTRCWGFNPCSYSFLADEGRVNFSINSFSQLANMTVFPVTLDWAIGNLSCKEARIDLVSFACKAEHSRCSNSTNGMGYHCNCSEGFHGNPYVRHGCHDIDECKTFAPCIKRCRNTKGSYVCSCPWDMYGDGKKNGSGCKSIWKLLYRILIGGFSILILVALSSWIYWITIKRRHIQLKEKFFRKNGDLLLQQQISSLESNGQATRTFTKEELVKATDNYKESRIIGQEAIGTVYKGILADKSVVAIKKCRISNKNVTTQFINEVEILSYINHRNVLKLLGCCLETRVPLLVYEYIPNETLFHHLHSERLKASLSLECRLRIAAEVAGALAYLHSAITIPVFHRDIKSSNILLDDNYTAKVADFGTSKLVPFEQKDINSLVKGTFDYLDPKYFYTAKFTEKSDVYSFGVVLVELMTGKKPVEPTETSGFTSLAMHFISCFRQGYHLQILEDRVLKEGSPKLLTALAELAKQCLSLKREERPTMKEVAMELEVLRTPNMHLLVEKNEEKEGDLLMAVESFTMGSTIVGDDSLTCSTLPFGMS